MIDYTPLVTFPIGPLTIYTHGLFMGLGMLVAYLLAHREVSLMKNSMFRLELVDAVVLWAVGGGLAGARLLYVIVNHHLYSSVVEALRIWEGGLISFGGFIGGAVAVLLYLRYKNAPLGAWADLLIPYLFIGVAFARIGDFLSWSEIGAETHLPWGIVVFGDVPRHPAQLYSTVVLLFLAWGLFRLRHKKLFDGAVAFLGLALYGLFRFLVEFVRDYPGSEYPFFYRNFAQIIAGMFFLVGGITFVVLWKKHRNSATTTKRS